jgi:hypothetical protein
VPKENNEMDETDIQKDGIRFHEINYGIGTAQNVKITPDLLGPTGKTMTGDRFVIAEQTDTVPAKIGTEFGVKYSVSTANYENVELTKVWIFPATMSNSVTHKKYDRLIKTLWLKPERATYSSYKLEDSFELIKGDWKFRIYYKHHLLYSKHFEVR